MPGLGPCPFIPKITDATIIVDLDCSDALQGISYSLGHTLMTSCELSLRLARPVDAAAIASLSRDLIEYGLRWRWTPERVAASVCAPNVNVLVARVHENIAGFAIMRYGDDDAHLDLFAVAPPYRRTGVGRQLLQWLEKCAVVAGIFNVALEVRAANEGAQRFYERMGYRMLAHLPGYYQGIEAALRMGRDLACPPLDHGIEGDDTDLSKLFGPAFCNQTFYIDAFRSFKKPTRRQ